MCNRFNRQHSTSMENSYSKNAFTNPNFKATDEDEIVKEKAVLAEEVVDMADKDQEDADNRYGWLSWRPDCLQWLNNPKGFLFFLCVYCFGQGMTVNGLVYVVITTLERRFNLPSVQSAFISSAYDFFFMFFVIFVTYFGERAHKPRLLGFGALIFTCGSIVFTLPHYLTGEYDFEAAEFDTCDYNRTEPDVCSSDTEEEELKKYYPVFLVAQALHALGACTIYTLGITYVDENSTPGAAALYTGIFWTMSTLGPAAGFFFGGMFLDIYTDINAENVNLNPDSPLWVGAWWLGFIVTACINFLVVMPLLGFNQYLPSYREAQKKRARETRTGAEYEAETTGMNKLKDFPKAVWTLLKNPTYLFIDLAVICEAFLLAFISVFGPKIVESLFNLNSGDAALVTGVILTPAGVIGPITGGYIMKRFDLKVNQILKFVIGCLFLGFLCTFGFLLSCPNVPFAGVSVAYQNSTLDIIGNTNLTAPCNSNCKCEDSFDTVCGSDGVMYYSSCHAGCLTETEDEDGNKEYSDCTCIPGNSSNVFGTVSSGRCSSMCSNMVPWLVVVFGALLFTFMVPVPYVTATMRCVDYSQRSFALGLQTLLNKALGVVPGPIAFGALVDKSCLLWEYECSGSQNCWVYNNWQISVYTLLMALGCRACALVFYSLALATYKPPEETYEKEDIVKYESKEEKVELRPVVDYPE
ncbi:solute carrier organic anion transporter family member 4A1-like [Amphiura filiformis]|uniref:solute carrier organic anion transporter family member 4A1-like n=1 Tax=Amphiura filiformis TaxID=82378 RepID=UPI003B21A38D